MKRGRPSHRHGARTALVAAILALAPACAGEQERGSESVDSVDPSPAPPAEERKGSSSGDGAEQSAAGEEGRPAGPTTRVTRVIDGDTVVTSDLGRVRLIGVDTPEEGRCDETAATRFTRERIGGQVVRYRLGEEETDRYGRTLAYLSHDGRMHNLELVEEGYAEALTIPPNDRYADRFEAAQRRARRRNEGLWGRCERRSQRSTSQQRSRRPKTGGGGGESVGLPPPPPDLDCSNVDGPVAVGPSAPHRLDADGDGVACE